MSWVAVAIGGSAVIGAGVGMYSANKASNAQADAAAAAQATQLQMFNRTQANLQPYMDTGKGALISLGQLYGINGAGPYNEASLAAFRNSPDYQVALKEGISALDMSNAARGMLRSSNHLAGVQTLGADLGSKNFGNYTNRLLQLAQLGGNAAAGAGNLGTQQGNSLANTIMAGGQAEASGIVGGANAITGGLNTGMNNLMFWNAMNKGSAPAAPAWGTGSAPVSYMPSGSGSGWAGSIPAMADGGRPPVGEPVLVGERGPELFVPDQSGYVVPNWVLGNPAPTGTPRERFAADDSAQRRAIRALEDLRRAMGVQASTPGGRATDEALKAIQDALRLAPGNR